MKNTPTILVFCIKTMEMCVCSVLQFVSYKLSPLFLYTKKNAKKEKKKKKIDVADDSNNNGRHLKS